MLVYGLAFKGLGLKVYLRGFNGQDFKLVWQAVGIGAEETKQSKSRIQGSLRA